MTAPPPGRLLRVSGRMPRGARPGGQEVAGAAHRAPGALGGQALELAGLGASPPVAAPGIVRAARAAATRRQAPL